MGLGSSKQEGPPAPPPTWTVDSSSPQGDGVRLAVLDLGGSGRTPVLLLHAAGFNGWAYEPFARALGAKGFRCLALDLRGHGASGTPADPERGFAWEVMVQDVLAAVGAVGVRGCLCFGHSIGGGLAVAAELASPGTFSSIFAFEPIIVPPPASARRFLEEGEAYAREGSELANVARKRRAFFPSKAAALRAWGGKPPLDALCEEALEAYVEAGLKESKGARGGFELCCTPESEARCYEAPARGGGGVFRGLRRVGCPVAVASSSLGGEAMPAAFAGVVAGELAHGTQLEVPGVGHFGPLESPGLVAGLAADFFLRPPRSRL